MAIIEEPNSMERSPEEIIHRRTTKIEGILVFGAISTLFAGAIALAASGGVRKTIDEYVTQYQGKPAVLKKEEFPVGQEFYLLINGKDRIDRGRIITDDNKLIEISKYNYSITDYVPEKR